MQADVEMLLAVHDEIRHVECVRDVAEARPACGAAPANGHPFGAITASSAEGASDSVLADDPAMETPAPPFSVGGAMVYRMGRAMEGCRPWIAHGSIWARR